MDQYPPATTELFKHSIFMSALQQQASRPALLKKRSTQMQASSRVHFDLAASASKIGRGDTSMAELADPHTIDLVAQDAEGRIRVIMVESRPWGADDRQPSQLRAKVNAYVGWILDGGPIRQFPEASGKPVDIQLDCPAVPTGEIAKIVDHAARQLKQLGIGFRVNVWGTTDAT